MIRPFTYHRVSGVEEACSALALLGPSARVLAGGTDLVISLRGDTERRELAVIDIRTVASLRGIRDLGENLVVGALTTFAEIARSPLARSLATPLADAAARMGNPQVRNRATIGGNICNASPCADSVPPLLALSARLRFVSAEGERWLSVEDTIDGPYSTTVSPQSILTEIVIPKLPGQARASYVRLARRRGAAKARMAVAVVLVSGKDRALADVRIGCGSVTPRPHRMRRAEKILTGVAPTKEKVRASAAEVAAEMIDETGIRWSTEYKKPVVSALTERALYEALGWDRRGHGAGGERQ